MTVWLVCLVGVWTVYFRFPADFLGIGFYGLFSGFAGCTRGDFWALGLVGWVFLGLLTFVRVVGLVGTLVLKFVEGWYNIDILAIFFDGLGFAGLCVLVFTFGV